MREGYFWRAPGDSWSAVADRLGASGQADYTESVAIFDTLFKILDDADVRYIVVGGLAVVLHGHARLTADLDLIIDLDPGEARRAISALVDAGFRPQVPVPPEQFADPATRRSRIRDKGMRVFSMSDPENSMRIVDLFVENPIPFDELLSRSEVLHLQTASVRIAAIDDLIRLKEMAGRPKDLDDIEKLHEIKRLRGEAS